MAKISALTDGATPQGTDEFVVRRGTGNNKLTFAQIEAGLTLSALTGAVTDGQIPAGIARDAEVTSEISTHAAAADPHAV